MSSPIRVFQAASGNVGTVMAQRILARQDMELVGLHCYSPDKVGRDVGEIVGIDPIGVTATGSLDDILAARPDCLIGMSVTAVSALNSIPAVVAAPPGIVTSADLPIRAFAGRFAR